MEKVKLILLLFSISIYSQSEIVNDNDLTLIEKIADSLYKNKEFLKASKYYEKLTISNQDNFKYVYQYAVSFGLYVESLPRLQQVKYVRQMIKQFENAFDIKKDDLQINRTLLEIYLRVPRFFGGGNKKAKFIVDNIYKISEEEGKKSEIFYNNY